MAPGVYVTGDVIQITPLTPKSGYMVNQHGKVATAAVVAMLTGYVPDASPLYTNTYYSFVTPDEAMHVATVHRCNTTEHTMVTVPGISGLSSVPSPTEGKLV